MDKKEIQLLSYRLASLEGITVNKQLFEQKLMEDSSMSGAIAILRASFQKDVRTENQVFSFDADGSSNNQSKVWSLQAERPLDQDQDQD